MRMVSALVSLLASLTFWTADAEEFYVIPMDVDPPVVVDADLSDWANVPNPIVINRREQVTWGKETWTGPEDLSGTIRLVWRPDGICLAAEVIDDVLQQPYTGQDIFNGDHVNLWIDLLPGVDPERPALGRGQFHLVVSPGNLAEAGEGVTVTKPEVFFYIPEGMAAKDCVAAARRTANGYIVEAYIPFATLNMSGMERNQDVNFEVAISDSDVTPPKQETFMTSDVRPWVYNRNRLLPMVLGDGNGKAEPPARTQALFKSVTIPPKEKHTFEFDADAVPVGKEAHLFFRGRIENTRVAGWYPGALTVDLNGKRIEGRRIANRPARATMMRGDNDQYIFDDGRIVLWYSPDFDAVEKHPQYALVDRVKACEFEFRIGGLLQPGRNTLVFTNIAAPLEGASRTAVLGDVELRIKPVATAAAFKPAPTGEIPAYEPARAFPKLYGDLAQTPGRLTYKVKDESFAIVSRFSAPDGKWHEGSTPFFTHRRELIEHDEWIEVRDTFTNKSDEIVPVLQRHTCALGSRKKGLWLGGIEIPSGIGRRSEANNPTTVAVTASAGVGLVALNDEFKVHSVQWGDETVIGLGDESFVLQPKGTYTAEWAIIPVNRPDFWAFINAARRMLDVNFRLDIMFAFMEGNDIVTQWSDTMWGDYIRNKSANFVVQSIYGPPESRYKGRNAYCTAFLNVNHDYYRKFNQRLRKLFPDRSVKHGIYYHCFIDNYDGNDVRFKDDRKLDASGEHMNYGGAFVYDKLYVPTLTNEFGKETEKVIDLILNDIGADGIFWDEFVTSRGEYVYNMLDGCSGDVDMKTLKLVRQKGSVALLSRDWRAKQVKRMMAHGPLMCSGAPQTRALAALKYHAFCETGSITNCRGMLLWTPIGLGDHITERTQKDACAQMVRQLDHGCLYAWYSSSIIATHKTLAEYMFPFTPIELHSGVLIGQERILTNRSGYFGWGDASDFSVHVFNRDGEETTEIRVPKIERDGKTYAEVRLPEGYAAAIVRVPRQP